MYIRIFILIIVILSVFSCNDKEVFEPGEVNETVMITDDNGNILGGNLEDWKQNDSIHSFRLEKPPYPNPVKNGILNLSSYHEVLAATRLDFKFDDGREFQYSFAPILQHETHKINMNSLGYNKVIKKVNVYIETHLVTSGHLKFE